ncbi:hypothetical protein [Pseudorhodoferax sp. Leaf267]|uniref:hypothetical protein n=1 Tax=Pseudorhodoferax sp. Leaf267 TaxID=1736316 RepID=UPI0006FC6602|nr:hypothetical protein [Pseudorhodoferax sp. Leaf267]KQP15048.1 hypothetical protein ASF43_13490 [Pseudorhodoferax sp. Leaf267]
MLFEPARHEALQHLRWDEAKVRACIERITADAESRFTPQGWWPPHPHDVDPGDGPRTPLTPLYFGACGVVWALHYLQDVGAVRLQRNYRDAASLAELMARNDTWLGERAAAYAGSFMMGELPIRLLEFATQQRPATANRLAALIAGNMEHPARELMGGSPGSLLAAHFLHRRTGDERWAELFRGTAALLWS